MTIIYKNFEITIKNNFKHKEYICKYCNDIQYNLSNKVCIYPDNQLIIFDKNKTYNYNLISFKDKRYKRFNFNKKIDSELLSEYRCDYINDIFDEYTYSDISEHLHIMDKDELEHLQSSQDYNTTKDYVRAMCCDENLELFTKPIQIIIEYLNIKLTYEYYYIYYSLHGFEDIYYSIDEIYVVTFTLTNDNKIIEYFNSTNFYHKLIRNLVYRSNNKKDIEKLNNCADFIYKFE